MRITRQRYVQSFTLEIKFGDHIAYLKPHAEFEVEFERGDDRAAIDEWARKHLDWEVNRQLAYDIHGVRRLMTGDIEQQVNAFLEENPEPPPIPPGVRLVG